MINWQSVKVRSFSIDLSTINYLLNCGVLRSFFRQQDDLNFLKKMHNRFHGGQGTTLAEVYRAVQEAIRGWHAKQDRDGITVNSCPRVGPFTYAKRYENFVMENFKDFFASWEEFDNAKSVYMQLEADGMLKEWLALLESRCEFNRIGFSNRWAVWHAHKLKVITHRPCFTQNIDPDLLKLFFFELLQATLPLNEEPSTSVELPMPWYFKQHGTCKLVDCLDLQNRMKP